MARLVKHTAQAPSQVETTGKPIFVCRCGLTSSKQGLCDGSHKVTKDEKKKTVYCYDDQLKRTKQASKTCCGNH